MSSPSAAFASTTLRFVVLGASHIGSTYGVQLTQAGGYKATLITQPGPAQPGQLRRHGGIVHVRNERTEVRIADPLNVHASFDHRGKLKAAIGAGDRKSLLGQQRWVDAPEPAEVSAESALAQVGADGIYMRTQLPVLPTPKPRPSSGSIRGHSSGRDTEEAAGARRSRIISNYTNPPRYYAWKL